MDRAAAQVIMVWKATERLLGQLVRDGGVNSTLGRTLVGLLHAQSLVDLAK